MGMTKGRQGSAEEWIWCRGWLDSSEAGGESMFPGRMGKFQDDPSLILLRVESTAEGGSGMISSTKKREQRLSRERRKNFQRVDLQV